MGCDGELSCPWKEKKGFKVGGERKLGEEKGGKTPWEFLHAVVTAK